MRKLNKYTNTYYHMVFLMGGFCLFHLQTISELFCLFSFPQIVQTATANDPAGGTEVFQVSRREKKEAKCSLSTAYSSLRQ